VQETKFSLVFGAGVLLLGGVASAGKSDESVLTRDQIADDEYCPAQTNHKDYRVERAEARGRNAAEAVDEARVKAYERLKEKVCEGVSTERCHANSRNVMGFGAGYYDDKENSACASVAIHVDRLNSIEKDLASLDATLADVAEAILGQSKGAPLELAAPAWSASGCAAGEVGAYLTSLLKGHLPGVMILNPGQEAEGMKQLKLELAESGSQVALTAELRAPTDPGWTQLDVGSRSFPSDLFTIEPGEDGECASSGMLGLTGDHQQGSGGLWARLEMPPPVRGVYCEGEPVFPKMSLNQDAAVRLYTVQQDGTGYLVWSSFGRAEYAARPTDLTQAGAWHVVQTEDGSDSQLVMVAVPQKIPFGSADMVKDELGRPQVCGLSQPLHASQFPPEAAIHMLSYQVVGAENSLCREQANPEIAAELKASTDERLAAAKTCQ